MTPKLVTSTFILVPDGGDSVKAEALFAKADSAGEAPDYDAIAKACGGEVVTHEIPEGSQGPIIVVGVRA